MGRPSAPAPRIQYRASYLWQIHFEVWQNQYNIVKFKNKIKFLKKVQ